MLWNLSQQRNKMTDEYLAGFERHRRYNASWVGMQAGSRWGALK